MPLNADSNCPPISSAGRLFDAVAYALGIAPTIVSWEGEAACHLEALANTSSLVTQAQSAVNIPVKCHLSAINWIWLISAKLVELPGACRR